jgi:hypothetical protein
MINEIKKIISHHPILFFFLCYLSIILGFYLDENSIGGAKHDYIYHLHFVEGFKNNFSLTIKNFASNPDEFGTRNSPIFFIIFGLLNKIFQLDYLRILNTLMSLLIVITFYNCLLLKYKNIKKIELIILSSLLFLSPTVRSLSIWPYSLLWGLFFFLITIFYYLKFELIKKDIKYAIISTLFLAISSYFYLAFSVFGFFFITQFIIKLDTIKKGTIIILLNILLALPAIIFFYKKNFYFFDAEGLIINEYQRYNISNKILIISSMIFYFCIPILIFNYKNIINKIFNKNYYGFKTIIFSILITLFFTFNYPITNDFGGGFFFKISHLLFKNNYLFYFLSAISLISILILFSKNKINYLILFILFFLYNLQFTIYNKYYEPLIFIISFLLLELNLEKNFFSKKSCITILYFFFISHYVISIGRIFLEIKF